MKKHILTLALAATLLASSCKRNNSSFDGPSLSDLNGQFGMLQPFQASKSSVDFSKSETVGFTAKFTKLCDWTIRIKGSNSGAQKFITGKSRIIDASTATWNGSTTVFPMFKNEPCVATLLVDGVTDTFNITIGITGVRVPAGFVVANFESGMNTKWATFIQSGGGMDFKIHNDQLLLQNRSMVEASNHAKSFARQTQDTLEHIDQVSLMLKYQWSSEGKFPDIAKQYKNGMYVSPGTRQPLMLTVSLPRRACPRPWAQTCMTCHFLTHIKPHPTPRCISIHRQKVAVAWSEKKYCVLRAE